MQSFVILCGWIPQTLEAALDAALRRERDSTKAEHGDGRQTHVEDTRRSRQGFGNLGDVVGDHVVHANPAMSGDVDGKAQAEDLVDDAVRVGIWHEEEDRRCDGQRGCHGVMGMRRQCSSIAFDGALRGHVASAATGQGRPRCQPRSVEHRASRETSNHFDLMALGIEWNRDKLELN